MFSILFTSVQLANSHEVARKLTTNVLFGKIQPMRIRYENSEKKTTIRRAVISKSLILSSRKLKTILDNSIGRIPQVQR
jgi:hypothetical protein